MDPEVYAPSACIASRAAELYFVKGASQREICDELGVSVATVSRLVHRAREESLVAISMAEPYASCLSLERDLKEAYGLKEVLIPPNLSPVPIPPIGPLRSRRRDSYSVSPPPRTPSAWPGEARYAG